MSFTARVIRFPLPRFRKVSQGEIIPMITAEVEPLGGFIGDSIALPVFQGGTLLVYLTFIFMQDPILGAAAVSLYPFQGWLIPRLQRKVNQLGKQRVRAMRQISDRIGESVSGMPEIHAHDTSAWHLADISHRYGDVYDIRFEIFQRKFFIKFLNNFINQLTPFFFYLIGGYLVIKGSISFGSLVAVLAAYKDLAGPWKELLDYYQMKEDIRIKYEQVIEQFDLPELMPAALIAADADPGVRLNGPMVFSNVSFGEDGGPKVLDNVSCTLPLDGHTAIVGGPGRDEFAMLVARLLMPTGGRIRVGDQDLSQLPEGGHRPADRLCRADQLHVHRQPARQSVLRAAPPAAGAVRNWTSAVRRNGSAAPMSRRRPAIPTSRSMRTGSTMWRPGATDRNRCGGVPWTCSPWSICRTMSTVWG